jgi:NADH:ubiquinone oxidoreductase subunit 2 (subunit N)
MGMMEFPILLIFIHFGGLFAMRRHTFIDRLIALEMVTLASYVLVTFERTNRFSTYAGVQYFIIGSLPSARLLLAFALFYLQSGAIAFQDLDLFYNTAHETSFFYDNSTVKEFFLNTTRSTEVSNGFAVIPSNIETSFYRDQLESIVDSVNPINAMSVIALLFLFFNFFFKLTVAPFHV